MILEEAATIEEEDYNEVLLPQMNVARREVDGYLNPEEPSASQTFIKIVIKKENTVGLFYHYYLFGRGDRYEIYISNKKYTK